jgi:hypothetical protein
MVKDIGVQNRRVFQRSLPVMLERRCPKAHLNRHHTANEFG